MERWYWFADWNSILLLVDPRGKTELIMLLPPFHNALVLTGPTGSGKSQRALELAARLDAEIVAMDSMTLYRGMDIGTAKPTVADREAVPHHLIDVLEPWQSGSVAWWLGEAKRVVGEIESRGRIALFVGGTPLYLKALIAGLFDGPPADPAIRERLTQEAEAKGSDSLHRRLAEVDPVSAAKLHPNDSRRIIRALEVFELTGQPISVWQTQWSAIESRPADAPTIICLDRPREELYDRINRRAEAMFAEGLIDEAHRLRLLDRPLSVEASKALGYAEAMELLDGSISREEAIARVQMRSRNLAKRQMTWFRHLPGCQFAPLELTQTVWRNRMKVG